MIKVLIVGGMGYLVYKFNKATDGTLLGEILGRKVGRNGKS